MKDECKPYRVVPGLDEDYQVFFKYELNEREGEKWELD